MHVSSVRLHRLALVAALLALFARDAAASVGLIPDFVLSRGQATRHAPSQRPHRGGPGFEPIAQLTGNLTGDPLLGDLFGATLAFNGHHLFVGSPYASPDETTLLDAGALYFLRKAGGDTDGYSQSQPTFVGPAAGDSISGTLMATHGRWLFVGAAGTPLDSATKDFSGAVLVFRRGPGHVWTLWQTLYNPDGPVAGAGTFFGYQVGYDGGEWMVVSGVHVPGVYMYRLDSTTETWQFVERITPAGFVAGSSVALISGTHMLVSQGVALYQTDNAAVFAFELDRSVHGAGAWTQIQNITGTNNDTRVSDFLGSSMAIDGDDAVLGAFGDAFYVGAAYFIRFDRHARLWAVVKKVFSTDPTFIFGFACAIRGKLALVGDPGRKVGANDYQGAAQVFEARGADWVATELLVDPNGQEHDLFGGGGMDIAANRLAVSSDRVGASIVDPSLPIFIPPYGIPLPAPGRVVVFDI